MRQLAQAIISACLVVTGAFALGPHEVALVVNANSASSMRLARAYAQMRSIPHTNIIAVTGIEDDPALVISISDFEDKIWTPVNSALRSRALDQRISAWIYSSGFPTTVSSDPAISITGMTFLRTRIPEKKEQIEKGLYVSPIFADPVKPNGRGFRSRSFDRLRSIHRRSMPLPSFMLAYTGEHGNTYGEAIASLKRGVEADFTAPTGTIYFIKSDDVRSRSREWQFSATAAELKGMGIAASIVDAPPEDKDDILGAIAGTAHIDPGAMGRFVPGAFADHLTSFGAHFQTKDQTKCTAWLRAGASASAGTVVEPFSAWPKFPHSRLFVHYASGCTLIESFYQSLRSPLQILPIGDPLSQPWAPMPEIVLEGLPSSPLKEPVECTAEAVYTNPLNSAEIEWYIDEQPVGSGTSITLDPSSLSAGEHMLRIIALKTGSVRSQSFLLKKFTVGGK